MKYAEFSKRINKEFAHRLLTLFFLALYAFFLWIIARNDENRAQGIMQHIKNQKIEKQKNPLDKVLVLNLDRRPLRYAKTALELTKAGLNLDQFERFSAVDGHAFTKESIVALMKGGVIAPFAGSNCASSKRVYNGEEITKGQIGHYLTYRQALQYGLNKNMKSVLLVEDDIRIRNHATFMKDLNDAANELPEDWDVLFLYVSPNTNKVEPYSEHLKKPLGNGEGIWYGTVAVAFSASGMRAFLDYGFPFDLQSDVLLGFLAFGRIEGRKSLNVFLADLISTDLRKSDISTKGRFTPEKLGKIC